MTATIRTIITLIACAIALGAVALAARSCNRSQDAAYQAKLDALGASFARLDSAVVRAQAAHQREIDSVVRVARSWAHALTVERAATDTFTDTTTVMDSTAFLTLKVRLATERWVADSALTAERGVSASFARRVDQLENVIVPRLQLQRDSAMQLASADRPGPIVLVGPGVGVAWTDGPLPRPAACLCATLNLHEVGRRVGRLLRPRIGAPAPRPAPPATTAASSRP